MRKHSKKKLDSLAKSLIVLQYTKLGQSMDLEGYMNSRGELRKNFYAIVYSRGMAFNLLSLIAIATLLILGHFLIGSIILVLWVLLNVVVLTATEIMTRRVSDRLNQMVNRLNEKARGNLLNMQLPIAILDEEGSILWFNNYFSKEFNVVVSKEDREVDAFVRSIFNDADTDSVGWETEVTYEGKTYQCLGSEFTVRKGQTPEYILMFTDVTEHKALMEQYDYERLCCGIIMIDNYDDVVSTMSDEYVHIMRAEVEKCLTAWSMDASGYVRRYDRDKYIIMFERGMLSHYMADGFKVLFNHIKEISPAGTGAVTVSVGLATECGKAPDNFAEAQRCIDIALGRGGEQVVLSIAGEKSFYGGHVREIERESKVKARINSNALRATIEGSKRAYIIGHKNADFDCLGAALGVYRMCIILNVQAYIIMDDVNGSLKPYLDSLRKSPEYTGVFVSASDAVDMADSECCLIVVDANKASMLESQEILEAVGKVAVIDHHRRGSNYIDFARPLFQELAASSTSEMVAEILQYQEEKGAITAQEATAMYMGMIVDTKDFTFKTGVRTFEAAAFLKRSGANLDIAHRYTAKTKERYNLIASIVAEATEVGEDCIVAIVPEDTPDSSEVAAQVADTLLQLAGNEASFVLAPAGEQIALSARSSGRVNVQMIMEDLGGGGHQTMAGAQLKGVSLDEAYDKLIQSINYRVIAE